MPVIVLSHLSESQRRALVIAANRIAENAGWDEAMLKAEIAALREDAFDVDLLGFAEEELGRLLDGLDADAGGDGAPEGGPSSDASTQTQRATLAERFGIPPFSVLEVWCAAGSGVLARALAQAWPDHPNRPARLHVVQVGRELASKDVAGATIHIYPRPFTDVAKPLPPFPSDPHYDAKAWETMTARKGPGRVVFWNVAGPARA